MYRFIDMIIGIFQYCEKKAQNFSERRCRYIIKFCNLVIKSVINKISFSKTFQSHSFFQFKNINKPHFWQLCIRMIDSYALCSTLKFNTAQWCSIILRKRTLRYNHRKTVIYLFIFVIKFNLRCFNYFFTVAC